MTSSTDVPTTIHAILGAISNEELSKYLRALNVLLAEADVTGHDDQRLWCQALRDAGVQEQRRRRGDDTRRLHVEPGLAAIARDLPAATLVALERSNLELFNNQTLPTRSPLYLLGGVCAVIVRAELDRRRSALN